MISFDLIIRDNHIYIAAEIAHQKTILLVDTGTNYNVLHKSLVKKLPKGSFVFKNFAPNLNMEKGLVRGITLSGLKCTDMYFLLQERPFHYGEGIMGSYSFENRSISIDYKLKKLKFFTKSILIDGVRIKFVDGIPFVELIVMGRKGYFEIDTGASFDLMLWGTSDKDLRGKTVMHGKMNSGIISLNFVYFGNISIFIGEKKIEKANILATSYKIMECKKINVIGSIGNGLLSRYGVVLDYISGWMRLGTA